MSDVVVVTVIHGLDMARTNVCGTKEKNDMTMSTASCPGDSVASMPKNDLLQSVRRTGSYCRDALASIVNYVYNNVPAEAGLSAAAIDAWQQRMPDASGLDVCRG